MNTIITNERLHEAGWHSWVNDDEGYFTFDNLTLLFNPEDGTWGFAGFKHTFKLWEEFLEAYKEIKKTEFVPGVPVQPEREFLYNVDDYPVEVYGEEYRRHLQIANENRN